MVNEWTLLNVELPFNIYYYIAKDIKDFKKFVKNIS